MIEQRQKIAELFALAAEKEIAEREIFLRAECGGDKELIAELKELLIAFDNADSNDFLGVSALEVGAGFLTDVEELDPHIGETLGRYKIIERIGTGGMGTIYLSERVDEEIKQRVAIKIIKRGMDSEVILKRFRHERQILANLEHPNIARLLDAGTTRDGLPFFVMELIEGLPIDEFCQANELNEKEKIELFRKVCQAVSFAHQKLIVHRDLKPSNILVNREGEPKLLDFGIAKLLDSTDEATQTVARALTPAYASPEQIRGEIVGTTSDVYSLGKVLAEILRIRSSRFKIQDSSAQIQNPKSEIQNLNADLQNIVAKALREDAPRRYQSVEQLSEDLRRYLAGLPITARRDSFGYRAAKFIQRNKIAAAIALLFVASLVAGLIATLWQFRNAQAERARAEQRFNDVRVLTNSFLFEFHDAIKNLPGSTRARELVVRRALEYLDNLARDEKVDDAGLQRELANAYLKIGDVQGKPYRANLGDTDGAQRSYEKARSILEKLFATQPNDAAVKLDLSRAVESVGLIQTRRREWSAAAENQRKAIQMRQELLFGGEVPSAEIMRLLSDAYFNFADVKMFDAGQYEPKQSLAEYDEAAENYQKSLDMRQNLLAAVPDNDLRRDIAQNYQRLGLVAASKATLNKNADGYRQSLEFHRKSLGLRQRLVESEPENAQYRRDLADEYVVEGSDRSESTDTFGAAEGLQKAVPIFKALLAADPTNIEARRDLATAYKQVALNFARHSQLFHDKRPARTALENYKLSAEIFEAMRQADPTNRENLDDLIFEYGEMAFVSEKIDDLNAAVENQHKSLTLREIALANRSSNAAEAYILAAAANKLGELYEKQAARNNLPADSRKEIWRQAHAAFEKSLKFWTEARARGEINPESNNLNSEQIIAEISHCDKVLTGL